MRIPGASMLLVLSVAAPCLGTNVVSKADLHKRAAVTTIFYDQLTPPVHTLDFVITQLHDGVALLEGLDKSGKPWRVTFSQAIRGLFLADLDGNRTYYFTGYTGGAGMSPSTWILVLSFDAQGRPVPFHVNTQDADFDKRGLANLLNLDGTGPELLQQDWQETNWMQDVVSGVFITSLYRQRGPYWYRADGRHGAITFPVLEKWAMVRKMRPQEVEKSEVSKLLKTNYSNDPASGIRTHFAGLDNHGIHMSPELGCVLENWDVVVRDSSNGREIETISFDPHVPGQLLPEIARDRVPVTLTGVNKWPGSSGCTASIIWAIDSP